MEHSSKTDPLVQSPAVAFDLMLYVHDRLVWAANCSPFDSGSQKQISDTFLLLRWHDANESYVRRNPFPKMLALRIASGEQH